MHPIPGKSSSATSKDSKLQLIYQLQPFFQRLDAQKSRSPHPICTCVHLGFCKWAFPYKKCLFLRNNLKIKILILLRSTINELNKQLYKNNNKKIHLSVCNVYLELENQREIVLFFWKKNSASSSQKIRKSRQLRLEKSPLNGVFTVYSANFAQEWN